MISKEDELNRIGSVITKTHQFNLSDNRHQCMIVSIQTALNLRKTIKHILCFGVDNNVRHLCALNTLNGGRTKQINRINKGKYRSKYTQTLAHRSLDFVWMQIVYCFDIYR